MSEDGQPDKAKWVRRLNSLIDGAVSFIIVCTIAWVFEKLGSVNRVQAAKNIQGHLNQIIQSFSPNQPLTYILDAYVYTSPT
jgi:hypothetical protein